MTVAEPVSGRTSRRPASPPRKSDRGIAALSGVGILLVVIGHAEGLTPGERDALVSVDRAYAAFIYFVEWIYTFHMPLFFAISGLLLFESTLRGGARAYPPSQEFLMAKAKRLLVPYFVISTLAFPLKVAMSRFAMRPLALTPQAFVRNVAIPWDNTIIFFWFLPTLFAMFALAPWLLSSRRALRRDVAVLLTACAAHVVFPHHPKGMLGLLNVGGILHNFVFFALGFFAAKYVGMPALLRNRPLQWFALGVSVGCFVLLGAAPALRLLAAVAGILAVFGAAGSWLEPVFARLGDVSYSIYLLSWFPQVAARVLGKWLHANIWLIVACSIAGAFVCTLCLLWLRERLLARRLHFVLG